MFSAGVSSGSELTKGSFAAKLLLEVEVDAIFEDPKGNCGWNERKRGGSKIEEKSNVGERVLKHRICFNRVLVSFFQSAL